MGWVGEKSGLEKRLHLEGHCICGIGASEINEKGGKSLGFQTCNQALRPLKLALLRQLMGWPRSSAGLFAALHVAAGAGHSFLVADNEMLAERRQACRCKCQAVATAPRFGEADDSLAAQEASPIRPPSLIEKEIWKETDTGWVPTTG